MELYFILLFALMAAYFLVIGIKIVYTNKPLLMPSKVVFIFMVLAFSPQLIIFFEKFSASSNELSHITYLSPLMFIVLLCFFWIQLKGYMAIGISDESFRNALHTSLSNNKIKFEEQLSLIKLTDLDAQLQVSIQSWVGTGQIKLKKSTDKELLNKLVLGINEYYQSTPIVANKTTSIFYIVMGLFMLVFAGSFYFIFD